jgi:hypothetical protein
VQKTPIKVLLDPLLGGAVEEDIFMHQKFLDYP